MTEGITFLDVAVEPTKGINEVIRGAYDAAKSGLEKAGAKRLHAFKVVGENRFVIVASGDVDPALWEMNEKHGDKIRVTSLPMRPYLNFAEKTLGVNKEFFPTEFKDLSPGGNMYWLAVQFGYKGMTIENLKDSWIREAVAALSVVKEGKMEMTLFKAVCQKEVQCFLKTSPDAADQNTWDLPMFKEMGDKIYVVCKPIKHME